MLDSKFARELNQLFADELQLNKGTPRAHWNSHVGPVEIGQYYIVPLTSPRMVKSEGYLMQNCVRQYIDLCWDGSYLLFSIRNSDGERVATMGAVERDNRWYFDDCLGKENVIVIETTSEFIDGDNGVVSETEYTELFSVAHEVVRLLNIQSTGLKEI